MIERFMVIGDDEALRRLISLNLRARGAEVEEVVSVHSLLNTIPLDADVVILDLDPDGTDASGWELARALRATSWARQLPLVVLGATWPTPAQTAPLQPLYFVRKPFAVGTLLDVLRTASALHL
ncbi:MAG: hypothetical protein M5U01_21320 [Ardenticatenaceae bacterium]|nr:hypothetical protein [Ardenticatenaceae bacterium]